MHYFARLTLMIGLFLCLPFTTNVLAQDLLVVRRAAFDIGSASIKCTIADVNISTGHIVKVVQELSRKVDFAEDMARSYDGNLSKEIMDSGLAVLKEFKLIALNRQAKEFSAIGGAAFRAARNGRAYFVTIKEETGIPCRITSMQQAALLSYHAVRQHMDNPAMNLLVWDIGGGSMQMTARNLDGGLTFYTDSMASVSFKNVVIGVIQKKDINTVSTPNPMSREEVHHALEYVQSYTLMNVPSPLASRISSGATYIVGIGGVHYYAIPEMLGKRTASFTRDDVMKALDKWTDKPDAAFKSEYANTRLTNLILVLGYMNALKIDSVSPLKINEADGLLVVPEFW